MPRVPLLGFLATLGVATSHATSHSTSQARSQASLQAGVAQGAIDAAVERGVAHLLELYSDGEGRGAPSSEPSLTLVDYPGLRALSVYTLAKSGVGREHPVVLKLLARLAFERIDRTYDAACMLLALSALDPVEQRAWIDELAGGLLRSREKAGDWGYPGGGDLSNTQFAALALRAAASAGVEIPADTWSDLARAVLRYRTRDGGFAYVAGGRKPTGSMTAAGVGTLALCETELARASSLPAELEVDLRLARAAGVRWLEQRFTVERNPEHAAWTDYYLYGLERMGALAGIERIGEHDWYREGSARLVASQGDDGAWAGTFERVPTLFALLFLRRATAPQPPAAQGPATRAADDATRLARSTGVATSARIGAEAGPPLRVWIDGFARDAIEALEWPGERGQGPRVLRVEYLADDRPFAAALGDPDRPAGERRFLVEHRLLEKGRRRLCARVHVRTPPSASEGADRKPAPADSPIRVLVTNDFELDVEGDLQYATAGDSGRRPPNLASASHAKATASSVFAAAPEWSPDGFPARFAVDGNRRTPWLAAADDPEPVIRISLRKPLRASLVRVEPARLFPRNPDFLTRPLELGVRVNGGETRRLRMSGDPRGGAELRFDAPVAVRDLEVRVVARESAGKAVGIGEIELW